jgi:hypothetical protein
MIAFAIVSRSDTFIGWILTPAHRGELLVQ